MSETKTWRRGEYDGQVVKVLTVMGTLPEYTSTASVQVLDGPEKGSLLHAVPIEALEPVHPVNSTYQDQQAMLLQDHYMRSFGLAAKKGDIVQLSMFAEADHEWLCKRQEDRGLGVEVSMNAVCVWSPP